MERHRATIGRRCLLRLANHGNERKCLEHKKDLVKDIMIGWGLHFTTVLRSLLWRPGVREFLIP